LESRQKFHCYSNRGIVVVRVV